MRRRKGLLGVSDDPLTGYRERHADWLRGLQRYFGVNADALGATRRVAEDWFVERFPGSGITRRVAHHGQSLRDHWLVYTQALASPAVGAKPTESE